MVNGWPSAAAEATASRSARTDRAGSQGPAASAARRARRNRSAYGRSDGISDGLGLDAGPQVRVDRAAEGLVEQGRGLARHARRLHRHGGRQQPLGAALGVAREPRGPHQRRGLGAELAAAASRGGGPLEGRGGVLVVADRGRAEMPGAALLEAVVEGLRVGPVGGPALGGARGGVGRGAGQRVDERDLAGVEGHQAGLLDGLERDQREPGGVERRAGAGELPAGGGDRGGQPGGGRQLAEALGERVLDRGADRQRHDALAPALERVGRRGLRELAQRQRVAGGLAEQEAAVVAAQRRRAQRVEQPQRLVRRQRAQHQLLEPGQPAIVGGRRAGGEEAGDVVGLEAVGGERERRERGRVEPVGIVDHQQDRALLGGVGQQREHRDAQRQRGRRRADVEREGRPQRGALRRGQPLDPLEQRPAGAEQGGVVDPLDDVDAGAAQDPEVARARDRLVEQGGLADAGVAAQDDGSGAAQACVVEGLVEQVDLGPASDQSGGCDGRIARTHASIISSHAFPASPTWNVPGTYAVPHTFATRIAIRTRWICVRARVIRCGR